MTLAGRISLGLGICLLTTTPARAAEPKAYRLELQKSPAIKSGRIAIVKGNSDPGGHRFMLDNLTILQPVTIAVATLGTDDQVDLVLGRDRWDERIKAATTAHGVAAFHVKTQGEIRVVVNAKGEPKKYLLMAWVGDPVKLPRRSVLKGGANTASSRRWIWIGGGIVALIAIAAFVAFGRKRTLGAAGVALAIGASASVPSAQEPAATTMEGARGGEWSGRIEQLENEASSLGNASQALGFLTGASSLGENAYNAWRAHEDFTPEDGAYEPNLDPNGLPDLPVGCGMGATGDACTACYATAQDHLVGMMGLLEQLRALYDSTKRYNDAMVSFGDSTSSIHAVSGLAWQAERRTILQTFAHFEQTYEEKRRGMMGSLRRALDEIGSCERDYFNNPDWYSRYGFIYYQFMDSRYKH